MYMYSMYVYSHHVLIMIVHNYYSNMIASVQYMQNIVHKLNAYILTTLHCNPVRCQLCAYIQCGIHNSSRIFFNCIPKADQTSVNRLAFHPLILSRWHSSCSLLPHPASNCNKFVYGTDYRLATGSDPLATVHVLLEQKASLLAVRSALRAELENILLTIVPAIRVHQLYSICGTLMSIRIIL